MERYELYHFGVPGMKWGIRKAKQLTVTSGRVVKKAVNYGSKTISRQIANGQKSTHTQKVDLQKAKIEKAKRAVKIGAAVAATVLAVYGVKKLNDALNDFNQQQGIRAIQRIQRAHDLSYQRYLLSQNR